MSAVNQEALRRVPQLEKLLQAVGEVGGLPRVLLTQLVREQVARIRSEAQGGRIPPDFPLIVKETQAMLHSFALSRLQPVINGTGVLIHTNLGRSPLAEGVAEALKALAENYSNLEFDLESGNRGKRGRYVEKALAVLCGAEAATVVNNCASALVLILRHLAPAPKNEVIISRGQLVEIGGGFRVPEIMETSGARLLEIGATNKVSLADYRKAAGPNTAMILRVHRSNFYMEGFVDEPQTEDLVNLARQLHLPLVEDLGSGAMVATDACAGIEHEPTPMELIAAGVDLVCFSGDKLFGGPQAGIIVGKSALIAGLKKDPFFRALRCDKLILGVLQETLQRYLHQRADGRCPAETDLPLIQMLRYPVEDLRVRGEALLAQLGGLHADLSLVASIARPGGGTMPKSEIPSLALQIRPRGQSVEQLSLRLRVGEPGLVGTVADNALLLDLRTIFARQDATVVQLLRAALA